MSKKTLETRTPGPTLRFSQPDSDDLREVLTQFWLDSLTTAPDYGDRIKASEMLAKYILESGPTPIKRRGPRKPPTSDVLRLAAALEAGTAS